MRVRTTSAAPAPSSPSASTMISQQRRAWALGELGAGAADVVRTRIYITDSAIAGSVGAVHGEFFGTAAPAATMVIVAGLLDPRWVVEIEAEALVASPAS